MILAALAILLTQRITRSVQTDSATYNSYIGQQVAEAFEVELMSELRGAIDPAETAIRLGMDPRAALAAVPMSHDGFAGPHWIRLDDLNGVSMLMVESQPLAYQAGEGRRRDQYFAGILIRDANGNVIGCGGWWLDPKVYIQNHLDGLVQDRIPGDTRLYGGIESIRHLAIDVYGPTGDHVSGVRQAADLQTARTEPLSGPFERFTVRAAPTAAAGAAWIRRFVTLEIVFIGAMGLVILVSVLFAYRYTVRQLELAQLKASFVSNVTHELKTPIALIRLAVETLEMERFTGAEERVRFLSTISRETDKLGRLVDNILDLARFESGHHVLRLAPVDVSELARETIEGFRPRLEHGGFHIETDLPGDLPAVRADRIALSHCLLNLLDNAVKYSKDDRSIRVSASASNGAVSLSVADRGIGIAPGDRKRIFEKFVRLEHGLVHDVKGAGLGLALVEQIMRAHGGRIEVSGHPGGGSVFTLMLPVTEEPVNARADVRAPAGS
jgi:signal transduction histidine kinase